MWPDKDDTLRSAVLSRLDTLDEVAAHADPSTLLPLARTELRRFAECWRLLLTTHRAGEDGRCVACQHGFRARRWPCQVWRSAHEQLIGEGLPHRVSEPASEPCHRATASGGTERARGRHERTVPLRNPFAKLRT